MSSNLNTVRDNVNQLQNHFDKLRNEIVSKLNEYSDCLKWAKTICDLATEMTTILENKLINESNEQKEWKDIKVKLVATSIKAMVILNIGGEKDTFFTALFSKESQLERDHNDGSIFIDRTGKIFTYILEYFRTNTVPINVMKDETLLNSLFIEAEYFRLYSLMDRLGIIYFPNGSLLQPTHQRKLNEFNGNIYQRWELIYKASRDGFGANAFHSCCNNQGPTMTIVQSNNNYLFGGYTSIPWTSDGSYKNDTTAFLFTLINPCHIPPTKYFINPDKTGNAVYHHTDDDPIFGSNHDIL
ncbi:unnamed protein product, partial [Rotaria sordida]